jgi:L-ascorbate metabolism protein UlaG (beta-lactamase superfamily)
VTPPDLAVTLTGGPTAVLEVGGQRLLVDPTFDPPGDYPLGGGRTLTKTLPAALGAADVGAVDAVLLSHDQHPDNLDTAGRALLAEAPLVLTTSAAAERLGGTAQALAAGEVTTVGPLTVTGFVLHGDGLPTVYVSGDNASQECVVVVHVDSWAHVTESRDDVRAALTAAGLADRLVECPPGVRTEV